MRNQHLKLTEPVPEDIRLEVYKEALDILNRRIEGKYGMSGVGRIAYTYGLCLLLPCVLYDVEHYCDKINDERFHYADTPLAFPELRQHPYFKYLLSGEYDVEKEHNVRLQILRYCIKKLQSK